ncbi:MAG: hypothetical protein ACI3XP_08225 [Eubacteriales bacterium]
MKKRDLASGIVCVCIGIACLLTALFSDTKLESLLYGCAGACLVPGVLMIRKYRYWSSPGNRERYQAILENERIETHDELKEKVRDRSGRHAYQFGLYLAGISIIVLEVLRELEIMDGRTARTMVLYLGGYLLVQIIAGRAIFHYFMKKY